MTEDVALTTQDRLLTLFRELGLSRLHIAARMEGDWLGFVTRCPDRVASLSLLCPLALEAQGVTQLASRMLVISGDRGASAERVRNALSLVEGSTAVTLRDYEALMWSDLRCGADRPDRRGHAGFPDAHRP